MAERYPQKEWKLNWCTVVVCIGKTDDVNPDFILECFETTRKMSDLRMEQQNKACVVQFPLGKKEMNQREIFLQEMLNKFLQELQTLKKNVVAVSFERHSKGTLRFFLNEFLKIPNKNSFPEIKLTVCYINTQTFDEAVRECTEVINGIPGKDQPYARGINHAIGSHQLSIVVEPGRLEASNAEAIACTIPKSMQLSDGAASKALLKAAGNGLQHDLNNCKNLNYGEVVEIPGHNLQNCRSVLLGIMAPYNQYAVGVYDNQEEYYRATIHEFVRSCLQKASRRNCKSIAFPAIGAGVLGYPVDIVADQMFETAQNWFDENRDSVLKLVKFIIFHDNKQAIEAFREKEKKKCKKKIDEMSGGNQASFSKSAQDMGKDEGMISSGRKVSPTFSSSMGPQNFTKYVTKENITVKVYCSDLLCAPVDCIVNAANVDLNHAGGIAKAIAKAAGKDLTKEGLEYLKKHGELQVGQACFTKAGNLDFKLIIHTVGPCWSEYGQKEVVKCERDLCNAMINSLRLAEREGMKTIAFPAISSGRYGCPAELCCVQYAAGILSYSASSKYPVQEIHIVDKNTEIIILIQKTFESMITKGKPENVCKYELFPQCKVFQRRKRNKKKSKKKRPKMESVTKKPNEFSNFPACFTTDIIHHKNVFCCAVSPIQNVFVYSDNLLTLQNIGMLALGETPEGQSKGTAATKFSDIAGSAYKKDKGACFLHTKQIGDVVVCKGGLSNYDFVAHAIMIPVDYFPTEGKRKHAINQMFEKVYGAMKNKNRSSLALALFGTGKGKGDPKYYSERFIESILAFCEKEPKFKADIHLVHMQSDITATAIDVIKQVIGRRSPQNSPSVPSSKPKWDQRASMHGGKSVSVAHKSEQVIGGQQFCVEFDPRVNSVSFKTMEKMTERKQYEDINPETLKHSEGASAACAEEQSHDISAGSRTSRSEEDGDSNSDSQSDQNDGDEDLCVICMGDITDPNQLSCGHSFCSDCIQQQFTYKQACPTCGKVIGTITGDQPDGDMDIMVNESAFCAGFGDVGRIEIFYSFPDGIQREDHPSPGAKYKGIRRTAYLPNNKQGREICAMLRVAFDRKLVFTIGRSTTTGAEGVITWNDIHHKTDPKPNTQFGYPDSTYLDRVTDELKIKGVTFEDIPSLSSSMSKR